MGVRSWSWDVSEIQASHAESFANATVEHQLAQRQGKTFDSSTVMWEGTSSASGVVTTSSSAGPSSANTSFAAASRSPARSPGG